MSKRGIKKVMNSVNQTNNVFNNVMETLNNGSQNSLTLSKNTRNLPDSHTPLQTNFRITRPNTAKTLSGSRNRGIVKNKPSMSHQRLGINDYQTNNV